MKKYGKVALGAMTLMGALALASCGNEASEATEALNSVLVPQDKTVVSSDFSVTRHVKSGDKDYEVIWTSKNESLLKFVDVADSNLATADIHAPFDTNEDVEFTATIKVGKKSASQDFRVTVKNVAKDTAMANALASVKVDNFKESTTFELPTSYVEYKDAINFTYSLEGTPTTTTLNNNVLTMTVGSSAETVKLNVTAKTGDTEKSKVVTFRVGNVVESVIELTPANVKTGVSGLTLTNLSENTKFPVEFNINKGGSIASNGLTNITKVVAHLYGTHDNMKMYAGKDATGKLITAEKEADGGNMIYTYTFPDGTNDFYFVNDSTYTVNPFSVKVYYTGSLNPSTPSETTKLDNPTSSLLKGKNAGDAFSIDACKVGAISTKDSLLFCYTAEGTFAVTYFKSDSLKATCEALAIGDTIKITSATLVKGTGGSVKGSITVGNDAQIEKIDNQDIAYPTFTAIDWSTNGYKWLASLTSDALAGSYVEFTNVKFQSVYNEGDQDLYSKFVFVEDGQTAYAGLYQGPLTVDGTEEKINTTDTYTIKCFVIGAGTFVENGPSTKVRLYAVSIVKNA